MNDNTIQLDKNTYAVIDTNGNTRIVSTINSNNQETMKNILLKENDIEELENKLNQYKINLKSNQINTLFAETLNAFLYIIIISLWLILRPLETTQWIALGTTTFFSYVFIKTTSCGLFGTRLKRIKQKKEIQKELPELEKLLETTKKELEKIKSESNFTELINLNMKQTEESNYKYTYKFDPNNCDFEKIPLEEINKEINVMKLSRIKRNPFQKTNL